MKPNLLVQFVFETGDTSCRFYEVLVVVPISSNYQPVIEGRIRKAFDEARNSKPYEDLDYENFVEYVMNETGLSWSFAPIPIGFIGKITSIYA